MRGLPLVALLGCAGATACGDSGSYHVWVELHENLVVIHATGYETACCEDWIIQHDSCGAVDDLVPDCSACPRCIDEIRLTVDGAAVGPALRQEADGAGVGASHGQAEGTEVTVAVSGCHGDASAVMTVPAPHAAADVEVLSRSDRPIRFTWSPAGAAERACGVYGYGFGAYWCCGRDDGYLTLPGTHGAGPFEHASVVRLWPAEGRVSGNATFDLWTVQSSSTPIE